MEVLLFGPVTNLDKISPDCGAKRVGSGVVGSADVVRNLGVMIGVQLLIHEHVARTE
jgi:hypothetical protein